MFLFYCIVLGLILAGVLAPIIMLSNKQKLKEMDNKIQEFEEKSFSSPEEKEKAKAVLKKELVKIKSKISSDKKAIEIAADKISIL
ncbi:MAG: hypothetical protein KGZ39_00695 [Simkania sp.]|nr:hypothetical protein [Simkania sp.]